MGWIPRAGAGMSTHDPPRKRMEAVGPGSQTREGRRGSGSGSGSRVCGVCRVWRRGVLRRSRGGRSVVPRCKRRRKVEGVGRRVEGVGRRVGGVVVGRCRVGRSR